MPLYGFSKGTHRSIVISGNHDDGNSERHMLSEELAGNHKDGITRTWQISSVSHKEGKAHSMRSMKRLTIAAKTDDGTSPV